MDTEQKSVDKECRDDAGGRECERENREKKRERKKSKITGSQATKESHEYPQ